jgi:hypothetical protein
MGTWGIGAYGATGQQLVLLIVGFFSFLKNYYKRR